MWTVIEKKSGKKICECGEETDAVMMLQFGEYERTYYKNQYLSDQVIDVSHQKIKDLPGQLGLPAEKLKLQENMQEAFTP